MVAPFGLELGMSEDDHSTTARSYDITVPVPSQRISVDADTGARKEVKDERHDLIPQEALAELATHYGVGARKYDDHNWRKGYDWSKSYAALQRHARAFWSGEDLDPETGSKHIIAVAWHAFALATFMDEHPEKDDRWR